MEFLIKNPEIKHGKIRVGFTPDEEISRGADLFDVEKDPIQFLDANGEPCANIQDSLLRAVGWLEMPDTSAIENSGLDKNGVLLSGLNLQRSERQNSKNLER